jgi:hypothetical protein
MEEKEEQEEMGENEKILKENYPVLYQTMDESKEQYQKLTVGDMKTLAENMSFRSMYGGCECALRGLEDDVNDIINGE